MKFRLVAVTAGILAAIPALRAEGQVDSSLAREYFEQVRHRTDKEAGSHWGVNLWGPLVLIDPVTGTMSSTEPVPGGPKPPGLGYANFAVEWGGRRWATVVWQLLPRDDLQERNILLVHELFHRVQPELGLFAADTLNDHLDTPDGRYWLQLEWRALTAALRSNGPARVAALADALAFRRARRARFEHAQSRERVLEMNEGIPQYTATVVATDTPLEAAVSAVKQLEAAPIRNTSFVRTFAYPSGAAMGVLLDAFDPGWTHRFRIGMDLGDVLGQAAHVRDTLDANDAAARYEGPSLRRSEEEREAKRVTFVAEYRRQFVEGPVIIVPRPQSFTFRTEGITPIPGVGIVYPTFRGTGPWGTLDGSLVLMSPDRDIVAVPAAGPPNGTPITGPGWTLQLAADWKLEPADRAGDWRVVKRSP